MRLLLLLCLMLSSTISAHERTINLNEGWQYKCANKEEAWRAATVPGSVQRDLIQEKILPDPFWADNEKKVQWPEEEDWDFKTSFTLSQEALHHGGATLTFEGLDTYADVYLNGAQILQADNMFLRYDLDVRSLLQEGENLLTIRFYSPITRLLPLRESAGYDYPAGNDHREEKLSVYTRKAPYHYGWDWGMRLVQMGIWRPVSLTLYDKVRIDDLHLSPTEVSKEKATIDQQVTIHSIGDEEQSAILVLTCQHDNRTVARHEYPVQLKSGINHFSFPLAINTPQLWMPIGWGKQHMYDFSVDVMIDGKGYATRNERTGLRTLKVINEEEENGRSFYFEVNGHPLFAKGANYIPGDIINTRQDSAYYERLFDNIVAANMNMVRIWGGGIYEDDYFYRLADEKGILVWQDFMFACTPYPSDQAFMRRVEAEAEQQIRRLRNHPSLAIWCGNNEVDEALKYWGFDKQFSPERMRAFTEGYHRLFRQLLPTKVATLDPTRFYLHSSPDTANWGRLGSLSYGDSHYWGIWYGREPFEVFDQKIPRFMSEYGIQSFPEMKTMRSFAAPEEMSLTSPTMLTHQKSSIGNDAIRDYILQYYREPKDFDQFIYVSQLMQALGIRRGIEAHRRHRPYCMGSLYWQLNDSWPVLSWAGIDYYNNWKALHYHAQRAFDPLTFSIIEANDSIEIHLLSDKLTPIANAELEVSQIDFEGRPLNSYRQKISAEGNSSTLLYTMPRSHFGDQRSLEVSFLKVQLLQKSKTLATTHYFFVPPKALRLPKPKITSSIRYQEGIVTIKLTANRLVKDLFIETAVQGARFSDNFFDLLPGESRTITITSPLFRKAPEQPVITWRHLQESYHEDPLSPVDLSNKERE